VRPRIPIIDLSGRAPESGRGKEERGKEGRGKGVRKEERRRDASQQYSF